MRTLSAAFPSPRRIDLHLNPPRRLEGFADPKKWNCIEVDGDPLDAPLVVAIVGSRDAEPCSLEFARNLAKGLAERGVVVASGGAKGIDAAAHEGAMLAGGRTWAIIPAGYPHFTPPEHERLFERIGHNGGTLVWALERSSTPHTVGFRMRNQLLVRLSDAVVVVQAGVRSGSLITATYARAMNRPLWVVPPSPWLATDKFAGNIEELERSPRVNETRARALMSVDAFFKTLQLEASLPVDDQPRNDAAEVAILRALRDAHDSGAPSVHADEIALRSELSPQQVSSALLTLSLEALVLEGPGGFYRRQAVARPVSSATVTRPLR